MRPANSSLKLTEQISSPIADCSITVVTTAIIRLELVCLIAIRSLHGLSRGQDGVMVIHCAVCAIWKVVCAASKVVSISSEVNLNLKKLDISANNYLLPELALTRF